MLLPAVDLSRPYSALSPTLDADVLVVLAGTTRPLTGREVARLARRGSQRGVSSVLERLVEQGLVDRQEAGRALLYTLNRGHLAAPAVDILSGLRSELLRRLRASLGAWNIRPLHASLFGSAARGEGDARSDIDLFIVRPDDVDPGDARWRGQLDDLSDQVYRWTGNRAGIAEVSAAEIERLRAWQPRVVGELRSDAVGLFGPDVATLLEVTE